MRKIFLILSLTLFCLSTAQSQRSQTRLKRIEKAGVPGAIIVSDNNNFAAWSDSLWFYNGILRSLTDTFATQSWVRNNAVIGGSSEIKLKPNSIPIAGADSILTANDSLYWNSGLVIEGVVIDNTQRYFVVWDSVSNRLELRQENTVVGAPVSLNDVLTIGNTSLLPISIGALTTSGTNTFTSVALDNGALRVAAFNGLDQLVYMDDISSLVPSPTGTANRAAFFNSGGSLGSDVHFHNTSNAVYERLDLGRNGKSNTRLIIGNGSSNSSSNRGAYIDWQESGQQSVIGTFSQPLIFLPGGGERISLVSGNVTLSNPDAGLEADAQVLFRNPSSGQIVETTREAAGSLSANAFDFFGVYRDSTAAYNSASFRATFDTFNIAQEISNNYGTYSLIKIDPTYTGNVVRVQRSSDNSEQDFGYVSGMIDTAGIKTFVGTSGTDQGYVVTWYSETGSNNATAPAISNAPRIIINGQIVKYQGQPSLDFDGTDDYLTFNQTTGIKTIIAYAGADDSGNTRLIGNGTASQRGLGNIVLFGTYASDGSVNAFGDDFIYNPSGYLSQIVFATQSSLNVTLSSISTRITALEWNGKISTVILSTDNLRPKAGIIVESLRQQLGLPIDAFSATGTEFLGNVKISGLKENSTDTAVVIDGNGKAGYQILGNKSLVTERGVTAAYRDVYIGETHTYVLNSANRIDVYTNGNLSDTLYTKSLPSSPNSLQVSGDTIYTFYHAFHTGGGSGILAHRMHPDSLELLGESTTSTGGFYTSDVFVDDNLIAYARMRKVNWGTYSTTNGVQSSSLNEVQTNGSNLLERKANKLIVIGGTDYSGRETSRASFTIFNMDDESTIGTVTDSTIRHWHSSYLENDVLYLLSSISDSTATSAKWSISAYDISNDSIPKLLHKAEHDRLKKDGPLGVFPWGFYNNKMKSEGRMIYAAPYNDSLIVAIDKYSLEIRHRIVMPFNVGHFDVRGKTLVATSLDSDQLAQISLNSKDDFKGLPELTTANALQNDGNYYPVYFVEGGRKKGKLVKDRSFQDDIDDLVEVDITFGDNDLLFYQDSTTQFPRSIRFDKLKEKIIQTSKLNIVIDSIDYDLDSLVNANTGVSEIVALVIQPNGATDDLTLTFPTANSANADITIKLKFIDASGLHGIVVDPPSSNTLLIGDTLQDSQEYNSNASQTFNLVYDTRNSIWVWTEF